MTPGHQFHSFSCGVSSLFLSLSLLNIWSIHVVHGPVINLSFLLKATGSQTAGHLKLLNPLRDCQRLCLLSVGF